MQLEGTPGLTAVVHPYGPPLITRRPVLQLVFAGQVKVLPEPGGGPYWPPYGCPSVPPAARFSGFDAGQLGVSSKVPETGASSLAPQSPLEAIVVQPFSVAVAYPPSATARLTGSTWSSGSPKLWDIMLPVRPVW